MRTLVAILAISSGLLHAQQTSPAQPVSTPILLAGTSPLPNSPLVPTHLAGISTGVVPARLVHTVAVAESHDPAFHHTATSRTVALSMTVDATGKPGDLQVIRPSDPVTTREVLYAVAQFRYQPATVSGVPTAQPVHLEITVEGN